MFQWYSVPSLLLLLLLLLLRNALLFGRTPRTHLPAWQHTQRLQIECPAASQAALNKAC
jgi:hypothetical protein